MKKLNIILISLLMTILMMTSVSALSLLSVSQVDFDSNNALYQGPAFVVAGVENGGNDIVTWTIGSELESTLDDGYSIDKTGSVSSDFKSEGWSYPLKYSRSDYAFRSLGQKSFLSGSNAEEWCRNLGGDRYVTTWNAFNYACIEEYEAGRFFSLNQGEYKYSVDYIFKVDGAGSDKLTLTDTTSTNGKMIGDRNWFQAVRQTDGVPGLSDPDIDDKIWLYYDMSNSQWRTVQPDSGSEISYNKAYDFYSNCWGGLWNYNQWDNCIDNWNVVRNSYLSSINKYQSNIDTSGISGVGTGSLAYDDGNIYRNPIVTLTINADKLGITRLFGKGEIVSVDVPPTLEVGQRYPFSITYRNVGDATMDASIGIDCNSYSVGGIDTRVTLEKGETRTDSGIISFSGNVDGCTTANRCIMTIKNTNAVGTDDIEQIPIKVCQASECSEVGASDCFGNIMRKCVNIGGVLQYSTIMTCSQSCVDSGYNAQCDDGARSVCGDGSCADDEMVGESKYCPSDCDVVLPTCGDGICDGREYTGQQYECVVGIQANGDCPNNGGGNDSSKTSLIIFGIVVGLMFLGAVFLRLKKEGYFDK